MTTENLPTGELVFKFAHEEKPLEIYIDYSSQKTVFGYRIANEVQLTQEFRNILGDPAALNIPSNRDGPTLVDSYPEYSTRIRFVKNLLYVWCAVQFAKKGFLGPYSPLLIARPEVEDYWNKEMLTIVIVPTLRNLYEARNYLKDISTPIIKFCESAYREIDEFLSKEVDAAPIIDEVQFQEVFRERLRQITAAVNVRAIQTLQTSHIDQLRDMGTNIATLERMMQDMPQYTQHVSEVRSLANLQNTLAAKIEEIVNSTNENKQELLNSQTTEISLLKNTIADLQTRLESEDVQRKLEEHNQRLSATVDTKINDVQSKIEETNTRLTTTVDTKINDVQTQIESIRSSIKDTANNSDLSELAAKIDSLEKATTNVVSTGDMDKIAEKLTELRKNMDERTKMTVSEIEKHKNDIYSALQEVRNIVNDNAKRQPTVVEIVKPVVQNINQPDPATLLNKKQRAILNRMYN
jgi:myosin heavy subunit